jgi:hypothetical protein
MSYQFTNAFGCNIDIGPQRSKHGRNVAGFSGLGCAVVKFQGEAELNMSEEKRIDSLDFAEQIQDTKFKPLEERLSSKRLFRIAAELQEFLSKRRSRYRRIAASANLTHYVE